MGDGKSSGVLNKPKTTQTDDKTDKTGDKTDKTDENNENNNENNENSDSNGENGSSENDAAAENPDEHGYAGREGTGVGGISVINNKDINDNNNTVNDNADASETVNTGDNSVQGLWIAYVCFTCCDGFKRGNGKTAKSIKRNKKCAARRRIF